MRNFSTRMLCGDYTICGKRRMIPDASSAISVVSVYKEGFPGVWVARARVQGLSTMSSEEVENSVLEEAVYTLVKFTMEGYMDDWWDTLSSTMELPIEELEEPNGQEDC
jgi:hypothetical protein